MDELGLRQMARQMSGGNEPGSATAETAILIVHIRPSGFDRSKEMLYGHERVSDFGFGAPRSCSRPGCGAPARARRSARSPRDPPRAGIVAQPASVGILRRTRGRRARRTPALLGSAQCGPQQRGGACGHRHAEPIRIERADGSPSATSPCRPAGEPIVMHQAIAGRSRSTGSARAAGPAQASPSVRLRRDRR